MQSLCQTVDVEGGTLPEVLCKLRNTPLPMAAMAGSLQHLHWLGVLREVMSCAKFTQYQPAKDSLVGHMDIDSATSKCLLLFQVRSS